jgi:hypothetical protein
MSQLHGIPRNHFEDPSQTPNSLPIPSIAPHFESMFQNVYTKPLQMICWWTHLLSSITNTLANAFSTLPKGTELVTHPPVPLPEMLQYQMSLTTFHCTNLWPVEVPTFHDGILLTHSKHPNSHSLLTCQPCDNSTKTLESKTRWKVCWWVYFKPD